MTRILKLIAFAVVGYIVYELATRYLAERSEPMPTPRRRPKRQVTGQSAIPDVEPLGHVPGASMTADGEGQVQRTLGPDGSSGAERVGRGVVRRTRTPQPEA